MEGTENANIESLVSFWLRYGGLPAMDIVHILSLQSLVWNANRSQFGALSVSMLKANSVNCRSLHYLHCF